MRQKPTENRQTAPVAKENLNVVKSTNRSDLRNVRIPGLKKPFEQMTISELTQLRPGGNSSDTYEVNAVTDNVSVTTSALLFRLGEIKAVETMKAEQRTRTR